MFELDNRLTLLRRRKTVLGAVHVPPGIIKDLSGLKFTLRVLCVGNLFEDQD